MGKIDLNNYEAFLLDYSEGTLSAQETDALKAFVIAHPELEINLDEMQFPTLLSEMPALDFKDELKKKEADVHADDILNYIEHLLSPAQKAAFEKKLAENKDLAAELERYKSTVLPAVTEIFEHKLSLIKTEDDLILNNTVIAFVEDQLSFSEKIKFEHELKNNPALKKELALVLKTRLVADAAVIYLDKQALKKENRIIALFNFRNIAAVAAAILLLFGLAVVFNYSNDKPARKKQYANKQKNASVKKVEPVIISGTATVEKNNNHPGSNKIPQVKSVDRQLNTPVKYEPAIKQNEVIAQPETVAQHEEKGPAPLIEKHEKTAIVTPTESIANTEQAVNTPDTAFLSQTNTTGQDYLTVVGDADEAADNNAAARSKNGFWKRAVKVARQVNKLGVKAVDGEEKANNSFHLSFNAFSVEKK